MAKETKETLWEGLSKGATKPEIDEVAKAAIEGRHMEPEKLRRCLETVVDLVQDEDGTFRPLEDRPTQEIPALSKAFAECLREVKISIDQNTIATLRALAQTARNDFGDAQQLLGHVAGGGHVADLITSLHCASARVRQGRIYFETVLSAANEFLEECGL